MPDFALVVKRAHRWIIFVSVSPERHTRSVKKVLNIYLQTIDRNHEITRQKLVQFIR